jgi:hypothetical protein
LNGGPSRIRLALPGRLACGKPTQIVLVATTLEIAKETPNCWLAQKAIAQFVARLLKNSSNKSISKARALIYGILPSVYPGDMLRATSLMLSGNWSRIAKEFTAQEARIASVEIPLESVWSTTLGSVA